MEFLQAEVENEERITMAVNGFNLNTEQSVNKAKSRKKCNPESSNYTPTAAGLFTAKENRKTHQCIFCSEEHQSTKCEKAKKMSLEWRQNRVKEKKGCFGCLTPGHINRCKFHSKCPWCTRKHALLLCREMPSNEMSVKTMTVESSENVIKEANLANLSLNPEVSLQTLLVKLRNKNRERIVRAVLDSGSQRSYVLKQAIDDMGYDPIGKQQVTHLLFGGGKTTPQDHTSYLIHLRSLDDRYACNFIALDQEIICQEISNVKNGPWIQELFLKDIQLTDIERNVEPIRCIR